MSIFDTASTPETAAFQRPIKDVFALQSEITYAVAAHFGAGHSRNEKAMLDRSPTTDLQAYGLYFQARALSTAHFEGPTFFANANVP